MIYINYKYNIIMEGCHVPQSAEFLKDVRINQVNNLLLQKRTKMMKSIWVLTVFKRQKGKSAEIILSVSKIIIALYYEYSEYRCSRIKDKNMENKDPFKKQIFAMYTCACWATMIKIFSSSDTKSKWIRCSLTENKLYQFLLYLITKRVYFMDNILIKTDSYEVSYRII